jgi:hypothetical protein
MQLTTTLFMSTKKKTLTDLPTANIGEDPSLIPRGLIHEKFYPSGAIAFFIALVILCLGIWFGIYFLMLERI